MYTNYINFLSSLDKKNIQHLNFKSQGDYNSVLEHVTYEYGIEYLSLIENEFSDITKEQIIEYLNINDKYGFPKKNTFNFKTNGEISCSPTSIRYIYHALLILQHYKKNDLTEVVEVGCGYGGLFLAICFFSEIVHVKINKYHFVDLPEVCNLINNYLELNKSYINIEYQIYSSDNFGRDIKAHNLFLISNYCFTEISDEYKQQYISNLFPKCKNGFIIWQTVFGYKIENANKIFNKIVIEEERPQTCHLVQKNYFVYF